MQESMIGKNIIITESSRNLRALGRNSLNGKWKTGIIAVLIYMICLKLPPLVFDGLFGVNISNMFATDGYTYGMDVDFYSSIYNTMPTYSSLSGIYLLLVAGPLLLGITLFFLAMFRKHIVNPADVFLGFERFGKALGLFLYRMLFIVLWTLLFIVPGIIAAIRYSQAFFILADDPSKGIRQCMNESKSMMRGNKAKYFCMNLSFIGWLILSSLPNSILLGIGQAISTNEFVVGLFSLIGYLFVAPVIAYMTSSQAGFYEILAGHLIKETQPVPVTAEEAEALEKTLSMATAKESRQEEEKAEKEEPASDRDSTYAPPEDAASANTPVTDVTAQEDENNEQR